MRGRITAATVVMLLTQTMAWAGVARPLTVLDTRAADGRVAVSTAQWRLVFSNHFNGGPYQWFDLAADPGATDNLATASGNGFYSNGALFDWDFYLGTGGANAIEYMTTQGYNAQPGALQFDLLEVTPARVRIRQAGHPRLNNGGGPAGDPFAELPLIDFTTLWTIYPTGRIAIDFTAAANAAGQIVDSGPGGFAKGISTNGTPTVSAWGGSNFAQAQTWAGDTIESASGGWGPVLITARVSPTQLTLAQAVPSGTGQSYIIRRANLVMETLSIHADGDPDLAAQCGGPATSRWQGGSNGDPLWAIADGSPCQSKLRRGSPPPLSADVLLAHWTRDRAAGSLLALYEPWSETTFGAFNDQGFTDISYTQLGRFGVQPAPTHHRHFLVHLGSSVASDLPRIKSVADAVPVADDYRHPYAEALIGNLATGGDIAAFGFDPGAGTYGLVAVGTATLAAGLRLDPSGGGRGGKAYVAPAVMLENFGVSDASATVEVSTNAGSTWTPLSASLYNLTGEGEEAALGNNGRRLFQYLGTIPATATGDSRVAFRFSGAVPPTSTTSTTTTTTTSTTTTSTLPRPITIRSSRFGMRDPADRPSDRRLTFRSVTRRDAPKHRVFPPSSSSIGNPAVNGASLTVYNAAGSGEAIAITLHAEDWSRTASGSYKYSGPEGSAVARVMVAADRLKVRAGGAAFLYTLDEPAQYVLALRLQLGAHAPWCVEAPAAGDSPGPNDGPQHFRGESDRAPASSCPPLP